MKITFNKKDEDELLLYLKEVWHEKGRSYANIIFSNRVHRYIEKFMELQEKEFKEMLKEALKEVLTKFRMRDLEHIQDTLGIRSVTKK